VRNKFFKKSGPFLVSELAQISGCEIVGNGDLMISDVNTLEDAIHSQICFLNNESYLGHLRSTKAGACILKSEQQAIAPTGMTLIISDNPYSVWAKVLTKFYPDEFVAPYISLNAIIHPLSHIAEDCTVEPGVVIEKGVAIGKRCVIKANAYIGENVTIGDGTIIYPQCCIAFCDIGHHCILHPGVRIGQDGFGFAIEGDGISKVKQIGSVIIGDNVEIGAGTCIDRGAVNNTIIGDNVKIDNLVQIGHNVVIGRNCVIVAQVGIAGSSQLGCGVMLGGQAGIAGHINIGSGAMVAAQSGVIKDVKSKEVIGGYPAVGIKQWHRQTIFLKRMTTNHS
jgi:UDP-3-O-[3-hydroxymyristoyl] glucosamine N-acyltransferase